MKTWLAATRLPSEDTHRTAFRWFLGICFLVSTPVSGADVKCNPDGAQIEMNACAGDAFHAADRELNQVYQAVLRKQSQDLEFVAKLRESQRAWIAFRDAELNAAFACADQDPRRCWGSMYPMCYLGYKTALTRQRTAQLKQYLEEGHEVCP